MLDTSDAQRFREIQDAIYAVRNKIHFMEIRDSAVQKEIVEKLDETINLAWGAERNELKLEAAAEQKYD